VRTKTTKHLYKGGQPKQPNKHVQDFSSQREAKLKAEAERNANPPKKPKDPLQGMREVAQRENLLKNAPPPPPKPTADASERVENPKPATPVIPETTTTEGKPKQVFKDPGDRVPPDPRPIPPPSSPIIPSARDPRRWLYYSMATAFALMGGYLYFSSPSPPVVHPQPGFVKSISNATGEDSTPKNVTEAISVLKEVFGKRCSTDVGDLAGFGGEGIMKIGAGGKPRAVVWPESTRDVEIILRTANTYNVPVIPHSGGTSLEGYSPSLSGLI
jgi:hypothetical protein